MVGKTLILAAIALVAAWPSTVLAQALPTCVLCKPETANDRSADATAKAQDKDKPGRALRIQIESNLEFGVAAADASGGPGSIAIDPRAELRVVSGALTDLGGIAFSGVARLSGQPFARVSIRLPDVETLHATRGESVQVTDFVSDQPERTTLDANGDLLVRFAGRLAVTHGQTGDFRGRIMIMADYE